LKSLFGKTDVRSPSFFALQKKTIPEFLGKKEAAPFVPTELREGRARNSLRLAFHKKTRKRSKTGQAKVRQAY
jgi:hypothetical protein